MSTSTSQQGSFVRLMGIVVVVIVSASCSQSGYDSAALTSPSSLPAGATSTAVRPGPVYDATGLWCGGFSQWKDGPPGGSGCLDLVQGADGNVTGTGNPPGQDCHSYVFTRVGDGAPTIRYRVVISPVGEQCKGHLSGLAELDIARNVIEGHLTGAAEDGSRLNLALTLTKQ